ncbi:hypothetical protein HYH03_004950 [Edaphochlamys debaryana]|uniref:MYND-type domain-containing protein n=1 Tax=Edaphochlamys debaryana TaxID=47281 RepID=A0A836C2S9_9CHLO|nr:hypothetical protein HYH03_004950 [Edaphochlamys debaryana]|eukprot:KAG2496944.1 hypothetical protein HYH03_004950 [Edaphochlamys debaryana]
MSGSAAPGWKALFAGANDATTYERRGILTKPAITAATAVLDQHASQPPSAQKLYNALALGTLTSCIDAMTADDQTQRQLYVLNDVVTSCHPRLASVLVEHNVIPALVRLHKRVGNMAHPVARSVVLVLFSTTLQACAAAGGDLEPVASKPELVELIISQLIFLATNPPELLSPSGLGTAQRCVQMMWELTRAPTPHCKAFRELLQRIDMAARLMHIAGTVTGRAPPTASEAAGADAAAAVAAAGALDAAAAGSQPQTVGTSGGGPVTSDELYEQRLALAAQVGSAVANLGGLGIRGIELSSTGLAPQRAWLLRPGTLAALKGPIEGLADGLAELRRRMATAQAARNRGEAPAAEPVPEPTAAIGLGEDLRPNKQPTARCLDQAEGAVRNLLFLLGLPTIVMGRDEEDVVEGCGFVIRLAFELFTEGYVDSMRILRDAVADPFSPLACGGAPFSSPYPGDYGPFFRAFAGHVETVAPALGVQLEDWGVRFTGEQAARQLPTMEVGEGVDARIAQSWLKDQIQDIINWGHAMMTLVRLADQAKMKNQPPAQQPPQQPQPLQGGAQGGQAGPQPGFPTPAAPRQLNPARAAAAEASAAAEAGVVPQGHCASCGAAPAAGGPAFQRCSKCRSVCYCSKACQVGHWGVHKKACSPAPAEAQAAAKPAAEAAPAATSVAEAAAAEGAQAPAKVEAVAAVEVPAAAEGSAEAAAAGGEGGEAGGLDSPA